MIAIDTNVLARFTQFGGYQKVRQGGVLFCGEHTSTDFQGFTECAATGGKRAASRIVKLIPGSALADD